MSEHALPLQPTPPAATEFPATFTSPLPLVFVLFDGDGKKLYAEQPVAIVTLAPGKALGDLASAGVSSTAKMHVRGEATRDDAKVQYAVHLDGKPAGETFVGLDYTGKHWVFNDAGAVDFTYLRNPMAFHMQRGPGDHYWAPHSAYFELFLCTTALCPGIYDKSTGAWDLGAVATDAYRFYQGLYINLEKVGGQKARLDLGKYDKKHPHDDDVGDLILQANHVDSKYVSLNGTMPPTLPALGANQVVLCEPKADHFGIDSGDAPPTLPAPVPPSLQQILDWWSNWATLSAYDGPGSGWSGNPQCPPSGYADATRMVDPFGPSGGSPQTLGTLLAQYTDLPSFARYLLLAEIAKDPDGYHRSTYMFKKGDQLYAGPLWDKNKSYGNTQNYGSDYWYVESYGWTLFGSDNPLVQNPPAKTGSPDPSKDPTNPLNPAQVPCWWWVLLTSKAFCAEVWKVWQTEYATGGAFNDTNLTAYLTTQKTLITTTTRGESSPAARDLTLWRNDTVANWKGYVSDLETYLSARLRWIDSNLAAMLADTSGFAPPKT
ncbi:CotH kinase family protein [Endothiovibrio diazotrophicus]